MPGAIWNLRKKLPNSTRKTLRGFANYVGVGNFLPAADEERLKREQDKEARELGLETEVKEVEDFAQYIYNSQQAMRNLGQNENTITQITQEDFKKWKTDMDKKGKKWESALKLFLKYRGKFLLGLGLNSVYKATTYDPHGHFNPSFIKPRSGLKYVNQSEQNYKSSIFTPEYTELPQFINSSQYLQQPPLFIQQPPIWTPSFPQLGRGKKGTRRRSKRKSKSHRIKRSTR